MATTSCLRKGGVEKGVGGCALRETLYIISKDRKFGTMGIYLFTLNEEIPIPVEILNLFHYNTTTTLCIYIYIYTIL